MKSEENPKKKRRWKKLLSQKWFQPIMLYCLCCHVQYFRENRKIVNTAHFPYSFYLLPTFQYLRFYLNSFRVGTWKVLQHFLSDLPHKNLFFQVATLKKIQVCSILICYSVANKPYFIKSNQGYRLKGRLLIKSNFTHARVALLFFVNCIT